MIVRILGEGQFDVPADDIEGLNELDDALVEAVDDGDHERFQSALHELLAAVRVHATPHALDTLDPSDVVLPAPDASLEEVHALLSDEGLVPNQ